MIELEKTRESYIKVLLHLQDSKKILFDIGLSSSLLFRIISSCIDFIDDLL